MSLLPDHPVREATHRQVAAVGRCGGLSLRSEPTLHTASHTTAGYLTLEEAK